MINTAIAVPTTYPGLRRQVEETLLLGQRRIEQAKVETYWKTGRLIHEHILSNASRSDHYGEQIIRRLAEDLKVGAGLLWRCVRFARSFEKIVATRQLSFPGGLTWSHYRELLSVTDDQVRLSFMKRAAQNDWTSLQLAEKIHLEIKSDGQPLKKPAPPARAFLKLIPKKGHLYTYRLAAATIGEKEKDSRPWIDLGFQVHRQLPRGAPKLKDDDIIETKRAAPGGKYLAARSQRRESDLFTYKGVIERIVDGDTMIVRIDLGFKTRIRQYLRLRGIDCPEIATDQGKRAKRFVERELSCAPFIILTSSRADKYDRYLADVFYAKGAVPLADLIYLNQKLLDEGLAGRMG